MRPIVSWSAARRGLLLVAAWLAAGPTYAQPTPLPIPLGPERHKAEDGGALPFREVLRATHTFGSRAGAAGAFVVDLDGDGRDEVVTTGSTREFGRGDYWYVLGRPERGEGYEVRAVSGYLGVMVATAGMAREGAPPVFFVLLEGGHLVEFDLGTMEPTRYVPRVVNAQWGSTSMTVGDADNDGVLDLVIHDGRRLHLLDPATLVTRRTLQWGTEDPLSSMNFGVAVGPFLGNGRNQIALPRGRVYELADGEATLIWDFGQTVRPDIQYVWAADLGEGPHRIVAGSHQDLFLVDVAARTVEDWTPRRLRAVSHLESVLVGDCTGDGRPDVIASSGLEFYCLDGRSGAVAWTFPPSFAGGAPVSFLIAMADYDGSGRRSILANAGAGSTEDDYLYVFDGGAAPVERWRSYSTRGPYEAVRGGVSLDGGGPALMLGARGVSRDYRGTGVEYWYEQAPLFAIPFEGGRARWEAAPALPPGSSPTPIFDLRLGPSRPGHPPSLWVASATEEWEPLVFEVPAAGSPRSIRLERRDQWSRVVALALADFDGDGVEDFALGSSTLDVMSGATGGPLYRLHHPPEVYGLQVGPALEPGSPDVVATWVAPPDRYALRPDGHVSVTHGRTREVVERRGVGYFGLALGRPGEDGLAPIYVGDLYGQIHQLDLFSLLPAGSYRVSEYPVMGLLAFDVTGDGQDELIYGDFVYLGVYSPASRQTLWRVPLGGTVGMFHNIDAWRDEEGTVFVAAGSAHLVAVYALAGGVAAAAPPAERPRDGLSVRPNPAATRGVISWTMPVAGRARLEVYDLLGRRLATPFDGELPAGRAEVPWTVGEMRPGVYLVQVSHPGGRASARFVVGR